MVCQLANEIRCRTRDQFSVDRQRLVGVLRLGAEVSMWRSLNGNGALEYCSSVRVGAGEVLPRQPADIRPLLVFNFRGDGVARRRGCCS